jgi:hypothetical protein
MDAKLPPPSARRRLRPSTLAVFGLLLLAGTLIQACSDNNGSTGPVFECREQKGGVKVLAQCTGSPAKVVGDAVGGPNGTLNIQATVTPGVIDRGRRGGVQILLTSANGAPIQGGTVSVSSPGGKFDSPGGTTDPNGTFSTTMLVPCEVPDGAYAINVVANGKGVSLPAAFTAVTSTSNDPCAGITPPPAGGGGGAPALPVVSIQATTSTATESTGAGGTFTVTRDVSSTSPLQVFYTVAGTATPVAACPGGDYVTLPGSVTIPANQTSATIPVTPCANDAIVEPAETVIVTISGNAAYSGGGNATVTIND